MLLTGTQIAEEVKRGAIKITDFDPKRVNPNSYNLKLHNRLLVYSGKVLDMAKVNQVKEIIIPPEGLVLKPNELYLGRTVEHTQTTGYAPSLDGRSSIGRLGMGIHVTAGFGDTGFNGFWTLEITVIKPLRVYAGVEICQIYYHTIFGEETCYKSNKYQDNTDIQPSMLYKDFNTK